MSDAWELRVASSQDAEQIAMMSKLPSAVVTSFVGCKSCCVATTMDGEVIASALVNTFKRVKDKAAGAAGGIETNGELMSVACKPKGKSYMKATALAALKMLKANGCAEVRCTVPAADKERIDLYTSLGLSAAPANGDMVSLSANLFAMNPDPQRKIEAGPTARKAPTAATAVAQAPPAEEASDETPAEPEPEAAAEAAAEDEEPAAAAA